MSNAAPQILNATIMSNGSMAVLTGNTFKHPSDGITYYGFEDLQVVFISANNSRVALSQSSGNLSFASLGDTPNGVYSDKTGQGDQTTGGGNILALPNGNVAVVTWGDTNNNYDLQVLSSSGSVVAAAFVLADSVNNGVEGNPYAAIATNGTQFVVAWSTDDITGLFYQRFNLSGSALGSAVQVKAPAANNANNAVGGGTINNNSDWGGEVEIDSQGNVILGFVPESSGYSGYYNEYLRTVILTG